MNSQEKIKAIADKWTADAMEGGRRSDVELAIKNAIIEAINTLSLVELSGMKADKQITPTKLTKNENRQLTQNIVSEVFNQLLGTEPINIDKSVMIKLTPEEIFNIAKMGAKHWKGALDNNTTLSMEEVCKFHTDLAIQILQGTDPDRFINQN